MAPPTDGLFKSITCFSSDCLDLDLNTTEFNQTIKF
jgi:hypothetical protein